MYTVVVAHNYYKDRSGEERVFESECEMLARNGLKVERFTIDNRSIAGATSAAAKMFWNAQAASQLQSLLRKTRSKIVHFHNTFPLMSPSVYYAARAENVAIVQTLHNYRLLCMQGFFLREGRTCVACLGKSIQYLGAIHACYRHSHPASFLTASMIGSHKLTRTWKDLPHQYICPSDFTRSRMISGGLPASKLVVKPNFVYPDPGVGPGSGEYAIFVGRLAPEKGIDTLLDAWVKFRPGLPLIVVGSGPLEEKVRSIAATCTGIAFVGQQARNRVLELIGNAAVAVVPSVGYETFGLVAVEAFARGTPVVASRLGPLADIVDHGRTGRHFDPGNPKDLAEQVSIAAKACENKVMRLAARSEFEGKYCADANYELLIRIYRRAASMARNGLT